MNKLSTEIKRELAKRGLQKPNEGAEFLGISVAELRLILNKDHIPRDRTLRTIADRLGLDRSELLLTAHRDKVPVALKGFFLSPVPVPVNYEKKRMSPLSQEQCEYLGQLMIPAEIQMVRKYRQLTTEGKIAIAVYIDYHFIQHRATLLTA